jgi:hypothetical protein
MLLGGLVVDSAPVEYLRAMCPVTPLTPTHGGVLGGTAAFDRTEAGTYVQSLKNACLRTSAAFGLLQGSHEHREDIRSTASLLADLITSDS